MRVATFNLFQFVHPGHYWYARDPLNTYTDSQWQLKRRWIIKKLEAANADIVGFQEVFSTDALKQLAASCGYTYFATVEQPGVSENDPQVFTRPVVAVASRLDICQVNAVAADISVLGDLSLSDSFSFRRLPIRALIRDERGEDWVFYIAHLKSRRPIVAETRLGAGCDWDEQVCDQLQRTSRGRVKAVMQNGAEATLLLHQVIADLRQHGDVPVVLMGDLNDDEDSASLQALTLDDRIHELAGRPLGELRDDEIAPLFRHRLNDAYALAGDKTKPRPATYFHNGQARTMDYILVSNALNPRNPDRRAAVIDYQVLNAHLATESQANRLQSDHGIVCVEISTTARPLNSAPLMLQQENARERFLRLAGGVFTASRSYDHWSNDDKWQHFWSFFFDTNHGWVPGIYGGVPVSQMMAANKHSIEHIVPKSFLLKYLNRADIPSAVRYGATVNPFNLAPAHHELNSGRSSFAFDMDGDVVVRPFKIHLNPDALNETGHDADQEWVVPTRTRGDIARAILYMLLTYDIHELYRGHLKTLIQWALVDQPASWEIAYNRWVWRRHGIRNPFIDTPAKAEALLKDEMLLETLLDITGDGS